jgi:hypothetical protein
MPKTRWTVDHMSEADLSNSFTERLVPSASLISAGLSLDQQRTSEELPGCLPEMRLGYQPDHDRHRERDGAGVCVTVKLTNLLHPAHEVRRAPLCTFIQDCPV